MKNIRSLLNYNLKLVLRDTGPMLMAFLMPIGFYILFGYMLKDVKIADGSMGELLIPLYIIIIIGNAVLNVFGAYYVSAKESGNIQKYKFLGISELKYSLSLFMATMILQLVVIIAFIIFTYFYAGHAFPLSHVVPVFLTIAVIELFHFAFTFLLLSLIKKAAAYNSIALSFYMFQMFLGGLTFPIEMFPTFLQRLVHYINPIIYGRNALLGAWTGSMQAAELFKNNVILIGISLLLVTVGIIFNKLSNRKKTAFALL